MSRDWSHLGEVWPGRGRVSGRSYLCEGSNPKILEWVRRKITERQSELRHRGDTIIIRGSYWEYKVQLQESFLMTNGVMQPTHADDKIHVWRRRV